MKVDFLSKLFYRASILVCTVGILFALASCGVDIQNPFGAANGGSSDEVTIKIEITGSTAVSSADIIVMATDGSLSYGVLQDDGSILPETVAIPWSYEYTDTSGADLFYSVSAKYEGNTSIGSGTVSAYREDKLTDSSASFGSGYVGYFVYNSTDDIFAKIESVDSGTQLTLDRVLFDESWRTCYIYQQGTALLSGTSGNYLENNLVDTTTQFYGKVLAGDSVTNNSTNQSTTVKSDPEDAEDKTLELNRDIFTESAGGEVYYICRDSSLSGYSATQGGGAHLLKDSEGRNFQAVGVSYGHLAVNETTGAYAQVESVDSGSSDTLHLDTDIFPQGGEAYRIYMVKSLPTYSTTYTENSLISSSSTFLSSVKNGDIIYNPYQNLYGTVTSVDSDTKLSLDGNIFPEHAVQYEIYSVQSLTITASVNGEVYNTITSEHWGTLEATLTGIISN
jgi:hypothetical protein